MRYTLEIQKLLLQTQNKNLHPREKANLLKEAIRIADENEDVEWATEMRLDLIYELNLLSADAEEITVFSKILDDYENHKDVIKEDDLLWKYKWIWACTFDLPEIPMEQVQAIGEDYKTRILRNGYSLRSYYHRWSVECVWMRQYDKAKEYIDKIRGLGVGADDYMTKPFGIMELLSRVKALLRRSAGAQTKRLEVGNLVLDDERHIVTVNGENCELTFKEYELLKLLMANCGMVLTREVIMERVWGTDFEGESRTLDMHIKTLRQKLGEEGSMIRTVRNVGYLLEKD